MTARIVVVAGGASGIGAACTARFAAAGDRVVVIDVADPAGLTLPAGAAALRADIRGSAACEAAIASIVAEHGRVDVLVNAAGVITRANALDTSDEEWQRQFSVNVDGTFFLSRAVTRAMVAGDGGAIVNIASMWGTVGGVGHVAYCAAKGAVVQLTRAMALDHARDGVRVNAVCPGEVDTPMLRGGGRAAPLGDAEISAIGSSTVPLGRVAAPDEIARVIEFLASPGASYMTGAIVAVDAGCTAA
ncbi:MAG TPA: SDR family oxidoreductase [Gaiellales bacterium]|jgi:NAD(P)-dependent dehydrogenase (short-subunit alcohol dehydrogenase family)